MYAFDPEELVIEPKKIDGALYVPYHTELPDGTVISTFLEYEKVLKLNGLDTLDGDDRLGTDDFRHDP